MFNLHRKTEYSGHHRALAAAQGRVTLTWLLRAVSPQGWNVSRDATKTKQNIFLMIRQSLLHLVSPCFLWSWHWALLGRSWLHHPHSSIRYSRTWARPPPQASSSLVSHWGAWNWSNTGEKFPQVSWATHQISNPLTF